MSTDAKLITMFDKQYSDDVQAEGLGVAFAVATGACNECSCLPLCETDGAFVFPEDAPCMVRKREVLAEMKKGTWR